MKMKRILSVILSVTVCLSLSVAPAFADSGADDNGVYMLCFGDSTTNGYALEGYNENGTAQRLSEGHGGFLDYSANSTIALLKDKYGIDDNHFENLCFEAQRPTEVRAFINEDYAANVLEYELRHNPNQTAYLSYQLFNDNRKYGPYNVFNHSNTEPQMNTSGKIYETYFKDYPDMVQRYTNLHKYFTDAVKKADVIVLDGIMSSLVNYPSNTLQEYVKGNMDRVYGNTLLDITDLPDELEDMITDIKGCITDRLDGLGIPASEIKTFVDCLVYSCAIACTDTVAAVKDIKKLNPDAEVIVVGPSNILKNLHLKYEGISIDVGGLYSMIINGTSSYLKLKSKVGKYDYVEFSGGYQTIIMELEQTENPQKLIENDPYLAKQILTSLGKRIADTGLTDELSELYKAVTEFDEYGEAQKKVVEAVMNSSHFKNGYDVSKVINALNNPKANLEELDKVVYDGQAVSEDLDAFLFLHVLAEMGKGAGVHPSVQGSSEKAETISRVINSQEDNNLLIAGVAVAAIITTVTVGTIAGKVIQSTVARFA